MIHTIHEFLRHLDSECNQKFQGDNWDSTFVSQLLNDFGVPHGMVDFLGCHQNNYNTWTEYMILYEFSKTAELGETLRCLGKMITRLKSSGYEFGIQELDTTKPDKYYILIYGIEEKD